MSIVLKSLTPQRQNQNLFGPNMYFTGMDKQNVGQNAWHVNNILAMDTSTPFKIMVCQKAPCHENVILQITRA